MWQGGVGMHPTSVACQPEPIGDLLEVLRMLCDGHADDIQGMLVVFLGREEERQQVEGIGIISAHSQGFLQLFNGTRDLPRQTSLVVFPKAHNVPQDFGARHQPLSVHQTQVRPWHWGGKAGSKRRKHLQATWQRGLLSQVRPRKPLLLLL